MTGEKTIPIITLQVEGMKHQIKMALIAYEGMLSEEIQKAVDAYCMPDNIQRVVSDEVKRTIDQALRDELHHFYFSGPGHTALVGAIRAALDHTIEGQGK